MRRRRRRDHHTVDSGRQCGRRIGNPLGAQPRRDLLGDVGAFVGDHEAVDAVEFVQGLRVKGADAAEADHGECGTH